MSLEDAATALGIQLDDVSKEVNLKKEKRFCFIIHILRGSKSFIGTTDKPISNFKKARKIAMNDLQQQIHKVKKNDIISIKCLEIIYCDVPVNTILKGTLYNMQPISSRWMLPEEIEKLI
jgi:hypothetical protein